DESAPICQQSTRAVRNVLIGNPQGATSVCHGGGVIAPPCHSGAAIAGKAVFRCSASSGDANRPRTVDSINRCIAGAGEKVHSDYAEADKALPTAVNGNGGKQHAVLIGAVNSDIALLSRGRTHLAATYRRGENKIGSCCAHGSILSFC